MGAAADREGAEVVGLDVAECHVRLEYGDRITVTTVHPGSIHARSQAAGVPLEGAVPVERLEDAVETLVRAAYGPPARGLAGTRSGAFGYVR